MLPPEIHSCQWMLVDLNAYFASVEQQARPELRGRPVAVAPVQSKSTCCIAVSYEAKRLGVKGGMSVREALEICPSLRVVEARPALYVKYHHRILEAVESCHPITTVLSIDEMACHLRGRDQREENALALAEEIRSKIRSHAGEYLGCSIGIAPNAFLAKVASDMQKPNGLTLLRLETLLEQIGPLPVRALPGVGSQMEKRLHRKAILTVRDLARVSESQAHALWGSIVGARFWRLLQGENIEYHPEFSRGESQKSLGHSHVLPPALRTSEGAYGVLQRLVHKAAARLRKNHSWTRGMSVGVRFIEDHSWSDWTKLPETQDTLSLLQTLEHLWRECPLTEPRYRLTPVQVHVQFFHLVDDAEHTLSLFESPQRLALSEALDQINERFGKDRAYFAGMHHTRRSAPTRIAFTSIPEREEMDPEESP